MSFAPTQVATLGWLALEAGRTQRNLKGRMNFPPNTASDVLKPSAWTLEIANHLRWCYYCLAVKY